MLADGGGRGIERRRGNVWVFLSFIIVFQLYPGDGRTIIKTVSPVYSWKDTPSNGARALNLLSYHTSYNHLNLNLIKKVVALSEHLNLMKISKGIREIEGNTWLYT